MTLRTFERMHDDCNAAGHPCAYWGERGHWLVVVGRHRESDVLERSNFEVAIQQLEKIDPDCYVIESETHWAVGWVEHLLVDPANVAAVSVAKAMREAIDDYPILDEDHFSNLEFEEACEFWAGMSVRDRVEACQESGVSIFAARRDYVDDGVDPAGRLHEYLTSC